jgi:hypothetical protein
MSGLLDDRGSSMSESGPAAVTLQVWRVPARHVPAAVVASQITVHRLRRRSDVSFAKVLGTASAAFLPTAITPRRWAALTCWREAPVPLVTWFDRHADERASMSLQLLSTRGSWDRRHPFGESAADSAPAGPILVLTRSTLRLTRARRFYRAIPAVAEELRASSGCRVAFGIGEAPLRRQGTVSLWSSGAEMTTFAYGAPHHRTAIATTPEQRWYVEELFTRFAVVEASGSIDGVVL